MRPFIVHLFSLVLGVGLWEWAVTGFHVKPVVLPAPTSILDRCLVDWPLLMHHAQVTGGEVLAGFALGATAGMLLALVFHLCPGLRPLLEPYLVASQLVPKVALAPLFIIWLGFGTTPKVVIAALVSFFPTFINAFQGLSSYDPELAFFMRCLRAGPLVTLGRVQLPFAVPYITAGLKTSALLSVTGCILGEFVGADQGLGFLLLQAEAQLDTEMLFACLVVLAVGGSLLYGTLALMEGTILRRYMPRGSQEGPPVDAAVAIRPPVPVLEDVATGPAWSVACAAAVPGPSRAGTEAG